jgi:hypothetical protein
MAALLLAPSARAQDVYVDCREGNPSGSPFDSITAAISSITYTGPARILLMSDCTENVVLRRPQTTIAPEWDPCPGSGCTTNGEPARITAADPDQDVVRVVGADNVTLVHLTISGGRNGLAVLDGASVDGYGLVAEGNSGRGITLDNQASLALSEGGCLNNGAQGLVVSTSSAYISGQNEPLVFSGNGREGIVNHRGHLMVMTGVVVENNAGWGFMSYGGGTSFGAWAAETIVQNNRGGLYLSEGAEISVWGATTIRDNGSIGVYLEDSSHVTFYDHSNGSVLVEGHSEIGVNITGGSQASFHGAVTVRNNGAARRPWSSGIRVDGHSQAFLEKGGFVDPPQVTGNVGPGIFVDLGSGLDAPAATLQGNSAEGVRVRHLSIAHLGSGTSLRPNGRGPLVCDSTSYVVTDLLGPTAACRHVERRRTVPRPPRPEPDSL